MDCARPAARPGASSVALCFASLVSLAACTAEPELADKSMPVSLGADRKLDAVERVVPSGALAVGATRDGELARDLELHGYELDLDRGAVVSLEVTRAGSARSLDTLLYVFGPRSAAGFGDVARAFDDDGGYGRLSRIEEFDASDAGTYLVVVGSADGRGRGRYRLAATCTNGRCARGASEGGAACHPAIEARVRACIGEQAVDAEPPITDWVEALHLCADAEPLAPVHDELCASASPPDFCALSYEAFATTTIPRCRDALYLAMRTEGCAFGSVFADLFAGRPLTIVSDESYAALDGVDPVTRSQIVLAVQASSHTDVTTAEEAMARIDEGLMRQVEVWDGSSRRGYTAFEYGAGDNSYGRIFERGTTITSALIHDGDLYECTARHGEELRDCRADFPCDAPRVCAGDENELGRGVCVDRALDAVTDVGRACGDAASCAAGAYCSGAPDGECLPAWSRSRFHATVESVVPDASPTGIESSRLVYGLAARALRARIETRIIHERPGDIRIVLVVPDGTEHVVYDGATSAVTDLWLDAPVELRGTSPANGSYRLRVVDLERGAPEGYFESWAITIDSRD